MTELIVLLFMIVIAAMSLSDAKRKPSIKQADADNHAVSNPQTKA